MTRERRELTPAEAMPFVAAVERDAFLKGDRDVARQAGELARRLWRSLDDGAELYPSEKPLKPRELRQELQRLAEVAR